METSPNCTIENHHYGNDNMADRNSRKGLFPAQRLVRFERDARVTYHERPRTSMELASSHTATFVASDIQYAI